jgi:hypothetical protein
MRLSSELFPGDVLGLLDVAPSVVRDKPTERIGEIQLLQLGGNGAVTAPREAGPNRNSRCSAVRSAR